MRTAHKLLCLMLATLLPAPTLGEAVSAFVYPLSLSTPEVVANPAFKEQALIAAFAVGYTHVTRMVNRAVASDVRKKMRPQRRDPITKRLLPERYASPADVLKFAYLSYEPGQRIRPAEFHQRFEPDAQREQTRRDFSANADKGFMVRHKSSDEESKAEEFELSESGVREARALLTNGEPLFESPLGLPTPRFDADDFLQLSKPVQMDYMVQLLQFMAPLARDSFREFVEMMREDVLRDGFRHGRLPTEEQAAAELLNLYQKNPAAFNALFLRWCSWHPGFSLRQVRDHLLKRRVRLHERLHEFSESMEKTMRTHLRTTLAEIAEIKKPGFDIMYPARFWGTHPLAYDAASLIDTNTVAHKPTPSRIRKLAASNFRAEEMQPDVKYMLERIEEARQQAPSLRQTLASVHLGDEDLEATAALVLKEYGYHDVNGLWQGPDDAGNIPEVIRELADELEILRRTRAGQNEITSELHQLDAMVQAVVDHLNPEAEVSVENPVPAETQLSVENRYAPLEHVAQARLTPRELLAQYPQMNDETKLQMIVELHSARSLLHFWHWRYARALDALMMDLTLSEITVPAPSQEAMVRALMVKSASRRTARLFPQRAKQAGGHEAVLALLGADLSEEKRLQAAIENAYKVADRKRGILRVRKDVPWVEEPLLPSVLDSVMGPSATEENASTPAVDDSSRLLNKDTLKMIGWIVVSGVGLRLLSWATNGLIPSELAMVPFIFNPKFSRKIIQGMRLHPEGQYTYENDGSPEDVLRNAYIHYRPGESILPEGYSRKLALEVPSGPLKHHFEDNVSKGLMERQRISEEDEALFEYRLTDLGAREALSHAKMDLEVEAMPETQVPSNTMTPERFKRLSSGEQMARMTQFLESLIAPEALSHWRLLLRRYYYPRRPSGPAELITLFQSDPFAFRQIFARWVAAHRMGFLTILFNEIDVLYPVFGTIWEDLHTALAEKQLALSGNAKPPSLQVVESARERLLETLRDIADLVNDASDLRENYSHRPSEGSGLGDIDARISSILFFLRGKTIPIVVKKLAKIKNPEKSEIPNVEFLLRELDDAWLNQDILKERLKHFKIDENNLDECVVKVLQAFGYEKQDETSYRWKQGNPPEWIQVLADQWSIYQLSQPSLDEPHPSDETLSKAVDLMSEELLRQQEAPTKGATQMLDPEWSVMFVLPHLTLQQIEETYETGGSAARDAIIAQLLAEYTINRRFWVNLRAWRKRRLLENVSVHLVLGELARTPEAPQALARARVVFEMSSRASRLLRRSIKDVILDESTLMDFNTNLQEESQRSDALIEAQAKLRVAHALSTRLGVSLNEAVNPETASPTVDTSRDRDKQTLKMVGWLVITGFGLGLAWATKDRTAGELAFAPFIVMPWLSRMLGLPELPRPRQPHPSLTRAA